MQHAIARPGELGAWCFGFDALAAGLFGQFDEPIFPLALGRHDFALDRGPVHFFDRVILKLLREMAGGLGVAGEQQRAADRPVEPVRDAEINACRFGEFFLDVGLHQRFERRHAGRRLRQ